MQSSTTNQQRAQQLRLVDPTKSWRIDARTREIGRIGVERARSILQASLSRTIEGGPDHRDDSRAA